MPALEPQAPPTPNVEWRLYFYGAARSLDQRINTRALLAQIRQDEFVQQVRRIDHENYVVVFCEGRTSPHSEEISRLCRDYQWRPPLLPPSLSIPPRPNGGGLGIDDAVRQSILSQFLSTAPERRRLAASWVQPIRQRMDYQSVARRTFMVEQLPDAAVPFYNAPPAEVTAPLFSITDNPTIQLSDIRTRRFDLIDRVDGSRVTQVPFEIPSWCVPQAWAYNEATDTYVQIFRVEGELIHLLHWRSAKHSSVEHIRVFVNQYKPCAVPREPTDRFSRILNDETPAISQEQFIQGWVSRGERNRFNI